MQQNIGKSKSFKGSSPLIFTKLTLNISRKKVLGEFFDKLMSRLQLLPETI